VEGDKVLRTVGKLIGRSIRKNVDVAFRYGGDEFVIVLPELRSSLLAPVAARIKQSIEAGLPDGMTVSLGVAQYSPDYSVENFVKHADQAMYESKKSGKGQIIFHI
jgi:diguanylate cyclase (GGDEF)-like protein